MEKNLSDEPVFDAWKRENSEDHSPPRREIEVDGNRLELYTDSESYLTALIADIRSARERVWIESYTISQDPLIDQMVEAVCERASAGLDCRATFDAIGSFRTSDALFETLRAAGVKVYIFRPLKQWQWRLRFLQRFNRRNHRKLVVIDGLISYFGGMNLVNFGGSGTPPDFKTRHQRSDPSWRDVHIRLSGKATSKVASAFLAIRPLSEREKRGLPPIRTAPTLNPSVATILRSPPDSIEFVDSRPRIKYRRPAPFFNALIRQANQQVRLAMAYFLPFGGILRSLRNAIRKNVVVEVIVPAQSDVPPVKWATQYMYERLIKQGIKIYERKEQMLHAKAMVVDHQWSVVGSCNFDPRSMLTNLEFFAIIHSVDFAHQLQEILDFEKAHSQLVSLDTHRKRNWFLRLLSRIAWSFRRIL
jgi:cardiolipin synthase A/B